MQDAPPPNEATIGNFISRELERVRRGERKLNDSERAALANCTASLGSTGMRWGLGVAAFAALSPIPSRFKIPAVLLGFGLGTTVGLTQASHRCLVEFVALPDSPVANEAYNLLKQAPQSALYRDVTKLRESRLSPAARGRKDDGRLGGNDDDNDNNNAFSNTTSWEDATPTFTPDGSGDVNSTSASLSTGFDNGLRNGDSPSIPPLADHSLLSGRRESSGIRDSNSRRGLGFDASNRNERTPKPPSTRRDGNFEDRDRGVDALDWSDFTLDDAERDGNQRAERENSKRGSRRDDLAPTERRSSDRRREPPSPPRTKTWDEIREEHARAAAGAARESSSHPPPGALR